MYLQWIVFYCFHCLKGHQRSLLCFESLSWKTKAANMCKGYDANSQGKEKRKFVSSFPHEKWRCYSLTSQSRSSLLGFAKSGNSMAFVLGAPPTALTGLSCQLNGADCSAPHGQQNSKNDSLWWNPISQSTAKSMQEHECLIGRLTKPFSRVINS